jgi:hypothetical protein
MKRVTKPLTVKKLRKLYQFAKEKSADPQYPRIQELGIKIYYDKDLAYIKWVELRKVLRKNKITSPFHAFFGIQTCYLDGPYAHDVEAVFERIKSGKLLGSQQDWD